MYTNGNGVHNIQDHERDALKKALTIYYSFGGRIVDAFAQVEPGLIDRYYRRKKRYPDEIQAIEDEAFTAAQQELSHRMSAFDAEQLRESLEIQRKAAQAVEVGLGTLSRIVNLDPWTNEGDDRPVRIHPRDVADAARIIQQIATEGIISPAKHQARVAEKEASARGSAIKPLPIIGVGASFTRIEAETPDGRRITASVEDTGSVIENPTDGDEGESSPGGDASL